MIMFLSGNFIIKISIFSSNGEYLIASISNNTINIYNVGYYSLFATLKDFDSQIVDFYFFCNHIVSSTVYMSKYYFRKGNIIIHNMLNSQIVKTWSLNTVIYSMGFGCCDSLICVGSKDMIHFYDIQGKSVKAK